MFIFNKSTKFPVLMIHESKHSNSYYLINDKEHLFDILFKVFKENYESGYYNYKNENYTEKDLVNSFEYENTPWEFFENKNDVCKKYIDFHSMLMNGEIPEDFNKMKENNHSLYIKFLNPNYWAKLASEIVFERKDFNYEVVRLEFFNNINKI